MKSKTSVLMRLSILVLALLLAVGGISAWWIDGTRPVDSTDTKPRIFVVTQGEGVKSIANNLAQQHLIRSSTSFYLLIKLLGIETQLQAGDFRLHRGMDAKTIAQELTHGIMDVWVTTLEGWRNEEIALLLSKELSIPEREFMTVAKEGYMFPDTYLIPQTATAAGVAELFMDTFDAKVTPQMREDAKKTGLTFDEVITLASLVEREGHTDEDRPIIAGILLKRLREQWPLQVDATLQYAIGYQSREKTWWKKELTNEDKGVDSEYNTYAHIGLPPWPICNPGLSAIRAVIYAVESPYWYYLHDPEGVAHYGATLEEHEANIATYLQ